MFHLTFFVLSAFVGAAIGHQCIEDWVYFEGSCYGYGDSAVTWGDAQTLCSLKNATLAIIDSAAENNFLKVLTRHKQAQRVWLGATDVFREGRWRWIDSTIATFGRYTDWAPNEPNNGGGNEDCLGFYRPLNYKWNDAPCSVVGSFFCEGAPITSGVLQSVDSSIGNLAVGIA